MFEGFEMATVDAGEAEIRLRHGGNGPPVLLLHGIPETHVMWHKVAPRLAHDFTVVATDLRDYGDSSKWSRQGAFLARQDVLAIWREWADDVGGRAIDCGHFIPEEAPAETYAELRTFLAA